MNACTLTVLIYLALPTGGEVPLPIGTPVDSTDSGHSITFGGRVFVIEDAEVDCGGGE
jgi:hypothetical protein